jgi:hypothetical protein
MILDAMDILSEQGRVVAEPLSPQHLGYFAVPVQGSQGPALEYKGLSEDNPRDWRSRYAAVSAGRRRTTP